MLCDLVIPVAEDAASYFILYPEYWQDPKKNSTAMTRQAGLLRVRLQSTSIHESMQQQYSGHTAERAHTRLKPAR
ncbi:hypothetical protein OUZ56_029009 [Daphnia magna]|uniref:Uncharacterized protein n=1 Tax=Daphnia magna TaxID=35525 RepID=A0ABR0B5J9_9CRUS|nr:hypothetical protein OUZ56_029009 [Daphnia magna]